MPTADRVYVDPSALRTSYFHEERSGRFSAWRRRTGGTLDVTRHGYVELVNAIELAVFRGRASRDSAQAAESKLAEDIEVGRLRIVDLLWRKTLDRAVQLSRIHTQSLGARSLDVLHVAAALVLEKSVFVTYDERQAGLARAVSLRVLQP